MQRTVALLAVALCAGQPSECDSGRYAPPPPPEDTSTTPIAMPDAEVTLIELPEAEAWRRVKSALGSRVVVLQPRALPERFDRNVVMLEYAYVAGDEVRYRIGYRAGGALVNFAAGAVNSAASTPISIIDVRGVSARYSITAGWPERQVEWVESAGWSGDDPGAERSVRFSVQARGVSEAELLLIVRGLVAVP
ncbi:MAG: hypothetical protein ACRDF9_07820 [Candidatus Limnocylindria bacterium]